jgi:hypothetical protein
MEARFRTAWPTEGRGGPSGQSPRSAYVAAVEPAQRWTGPSEALTQTDLSWAVRQLPLDDVHHGGIDHMDAATRD